MLTSELYQSTSPIQIIPHSPFPIPHSHPLYLNRFTAASGETALTQISVPNS